MRVPHLAYRSAIARIGRPVARASVRPAFSAVESRDPPPVQNHRILVVDDLPEICAIFKDVHQRMRRNDVEMVTETNSERALAEIEHERFDIVVSDFRMRQVDGIEVLKAAYDKDPLTFRVLMTGYNEIPTGLARIQQAQVDAYLQKPLHMQELILLLLGFLQKDGALIRENRSAARSIEEQADPKTVSLP